MINLLNNLWILIAAFLVFIMTISVGLLEAGELGESFSDRLILKSMMIAGVSGIFFLLIGFNIAFGNNSNGFIGNPFYTNILSNSSIDAATWWSTNQGFGAEGLYGPVYFMFEWACLSVTLALVSVVVLDRMKLTAFVIFSAVYSALIYPIPASWVWNPSGFLAMHGVVDFAGGAVVHLAAACAGLAILAEIYLETKEKKKMGYQIKKNTYKRDYKIIGIAGLLLWLGWYGFNPGSVLQFNAGTIVVAVTTTMSAVSAMMTYILIKKVKALESINTLDAVNGSLAGLIIITPMAGFVSPVVAIIVGIIGGVVFYYSVSWFSKKNYFDDPIGLVSAHGVLGFIGVVLIGFFAQSGFSNLTGFEPSYLPNGEYYLPNGLFFNGGFAAVHLVLIEFLGAVLVGVFAFVASFVTIRILAYSMHGILREEVLEPIAKKDKKVSYTESVA
ncbi:MAG: ammonium transporter [Thermoplasmata archaeon]